MTVNHDGDKSNNYYLAWKQATGAKSERIGRACIDGKTHLVIRKRQVTWEMYP